VTPLIDVHCHLTSEDFAPDLDQILQRAREAGITRLICMGETAADNRRVLALADQYPEVLPALGHYPAHLDDDMAAETEALLHRHRDRVVAIGEVGIDYWIATEPDTRAHQRALFTRFVRLALDLDLPLSVHSRSAGRHVVALLTELGAQRVCLHAFDGKARYALEAAQAGYYLSVPPSVIRSAQKQKLVAAVPLERLLLETDAPVLGPDREQRNEPANLRISVETIAELKGVPADEVRTACAANTRALFGPCIG